MKTESRRMRACVSVLLILGVLIAAFSVPLANASSSELSLALTPTANDLRISQVYGGGGNTGAQYTNDFIEIFNGGASTVSLSGWSVQYASATGSSWVNLTPLSGSLAPGQYYLVQGAAGTSCSGSPCGVPLPTADVVGAINLSGTNGKVALVNTTTAQTGTCPTGPQIIDFVGYGTTANCFEGSSAAPVLSNTTAALRAGNGCTDTDNNAADFTAVAPSPRNTTSPLNLCGGGDVPPTVLSTTPSTGAVNVPVDAPVSVTFSEPVTVTGTIDIVCTGGTQTVTPTGGPTTFTLPHTNFALGDGCSITILAKSSDRPGWHAHPDGRRLHVGVRGDQRLFRERPRRSTTSRAAAWPVPWWASSPLGRGPGHRRLSGRRQHQRLLHGGAGDRTGRRPGDFRGPVRL